MHAEAQRVPTPPGARPSSRDQVVVLRGVPWQQYDALVGARGDDPAPRMAYLDGVLEIMTVSPRHEYEKKLIARLLEAWAEERGVSLNGFGQTTYRKKAKNAGLEPDECYCLGPEKAVPDLAIEVFYTSGGVDKLEVYRRLEVPEVWFWAKGGFWVYRVAGPRYEKVERSQLLPAIDLDEIARIVRETDRAHQTEAVRAYRLSLDTAHPGGRPRAPADTGAPGPSQARRVAPRGGAPVMRRR